MMREIVSGLVGMICSVFVTGIIADEPRTLAWWILTFCLVILFIRGAMRSIFGALKMGVTPNEL